MQPMDSLLLTSQFEDVRDIYPLLFDFSDDRNKILSNNFNKYGCSKVPRHNYINFSSSTASNITWSQYEYVYSFLKSTSFNTQTYQDNWQLLRDQIRASLGLSDSVDIAFGASGTDLEYLATLYGCASNKPLVTYSTLPDETGSGCLNAASGKHFSANDNFGFPVNHDEFLKGFEKFTIKCIPIFLDDEHISIENQLLSDIDMYLAKGMHVQIRFIYGSKVGRVFPSIEFIELLESRYNDNLDIIVDCCQFRASFEFINDCVSKHRLVMLSGSKFFEGATFSGIFLIPPSKRDRILRSNCPIPEGIADYFTRNMLPTRMTSFDNILKNSNKDFGLYIRLLTFFFNFSRFASLNKGRIDETVSLFVDVVDSHFIKSFHHHGYQIERYVYTPSGYNHDYRSLLNTVIPFSIVSSDKHISFDEARSIYRMLYSPHLKHTQDDAMKFSIHLAQPIILNGSNNVIFRISLGASLIIELAGMVYSKREQVLVEHINLLCHRLAFILSELQN